MVSPLKIQKKGDTNLVVIIRVHLVFIPFDFLGEQLILLARWGLSYIHPIIRNFYVFFA